MEAPSPRYILTRAAFLIALLVAILIGIGFVKKQRRKSAIFAELQSITSDSSFFQQFYAEDARKSLIRAIALIAEAKNLGVSPDTAIDRGMGIVPEFFDSEEDKDGPPPREKIIRASLRNNYENFLKLGYTADFHTLETMRNGEMPVIPAGPHSGRKPEIATIVSPAISPGMEKVLANLELRPPHDENRQPTDIELAAAKELVRDLSNARIIEETVANKLTRQLSEPTPKDE